MYLPHFIKYKSHLKSKTNSFKLQTCYFSFLTKARIQNVCPSLHKYQGTKQDQIFLWLTNVNNSIGFDYIISLHSK